MVMIGSEALSIRPIQPEATSHSDNESMQAKELMSTSIPVHTPSGGDARDMIDQTDIRLECSVYYN